MKLKTHFTRALIVASSCSSPLLGQTSQTASVSKVPGNTVTALTMPAPLAVSGGTAVTALPGLTSINRSRATRANDAAAQGVLLKAATLTQIGSATTLATRLGLPGPTNTPNGWYQPQQVKNGTVQYLSSRNLDSGIKLKVNKLLPGGSLGLNLTGGLNAANPLLNFKIGLYDGGQPRPTHQEFQLGGASRIIAGDSSAVELHATAVAGTLGAAGVVSAAKGMAPEVRILAKRSFASISDMQTLEFNSLRVSNHSYGFDYGWQYLKDAAGNPEEAFWQGDLATSFTESHYFGSYTSNSRELDKTVYNLPLQLPVWAVANSRFQYIPDASRGLLDWNSVSYRYFRTSYQGKPAYMCENVLAGGNDLLVIGTLDPVTALYSYTGYSVNLSDVPANGGIAGYDTLTDLEDAKNVLSVGGVDYNMSLQNVETSTAHGPTDDGRIKPDVVAKSKTIYTTKNDSDSGYSAFNGTSFAAPAVAGAAHLISQLREISWSLSPLIASSLKAVVIHTADDVVSALGSPADAAVGPDFRTGWGIVNAEKAAQLVRDDMAASAYHMGVPQRPFIKEVNLANGQECVWNLKAKGGEPIRVTLAWTDPAGSVQADNVLDPVLSRLVNDLDLSVERISDAAQFKPWRLNAANPTAAASNTYADSNGNSVDNVEQVLTYGALPSAGQLFRVTVKQKPGTTLWKADAAGNLTVGDQTVSIVLSGVAANQQQLLSVVTSAYIEVPASGPNPSQTRFDVTFSSVVGQKYWIEKTTNLLTWTRTSDEVVARGTTVGMSSYVTSPRPASLFYRVRAVANFPYGIAP
jgi:Subtilase family